MIYLDSSALMKLIREESETAALVEWLDERADQPAITSELGRVEVLRAARRVSDLAVAAARRVISELDLVPLDRTVQDLACDLGGPMLRSLDALHLASALVLGDDLDTFVGYNHRLGDAARVAGLVVAMPGQTRSEAES